MKLALITVSYRGDFALARELAASVDALAAPEIEHVMLVPRRDTRLFEPLANSRRNILAAEAVLPKSFVRLPAPNRVEIKPFFSKRLREIWATPRGLARGWIVQQIVKLAADRATDADVLVFADSDIVFVRPFGAAAVVRDRRARLYHRPGETQASLSHRRWHREASKLLGLPETDYFGADYIGNLLSWRRDTLVALQDRIAKVANKSWELAVAGQSALSEYILYGAFAEHVLGGAGHYLSTADLTHPSWHYQIAQPESRAAFVRDFSDQHLAVLIQSTEGLSLAERRELIRSMTQNVQQLAS